MDLLLMTAEDTPSRIPDPTRSNGRAENLPLILEAIDGSSNGQMVVEFDGDGDCGRLLYVNPAFCALTGYSSEEITGGQASLLWKGPALYSFLRELHELIVLGVPAQKEVACHCKDGAELWLDLQLTPLSAEGRNQRWVALLRDVTGRRQSEKSLLDNQMRLNGLLNSLSDVVWSMDAEQKAFIYLSPATVRFFGRSVEEFFHDPSLWRSMIHPQDREPVSAAFDRILATGSLEREYRIVRPNGDIRWLRNKAQVIVDSEGRPLHIDGLISDVTTQKMIETSMERMANFPRFNPNPIYELRSGGELTYFNEPAEALAKAAGGRIAADILPVETPQIVAECLRTGEARLRLELPCGERTISWSFFPIPRTDIVHCYAGDITERVRLEAQLRQSEKLKSVGQLAGGIAHDFNNILTIIQGFTNLLLSREDFDDDAVDQLKQVAAAANKAADLTKQLLMFSRRQVLQPRRFHFNVIVNDLAKMLKRLLGEDIKLTVENPDGDVPIMADQGMIEQVIVNLASNARDAMPRGGSLTLTTCLVQVTPALALSHPDARPGLFVCLQARDTGSGMDRQTIVRIFEPFFTTKLPGKGTGLGLSTVYGIVKQHEGWVDVQSELGQGTTFNIYLPLAQGATEQIRELQEKAPQGGKETILVVEDEAPVRILLRSILQSVGYRIIEAKHGLDALRKWDEHQDEIHMLLTDLVMPGTINGIDLAERLTNERPQLKVIYSSGYSADVVGEKMAFDPGTNFLAKPYTPAQLLRLVRTCLDAEG